MADHPEAQTFGAGKRPPEQTFWPLKSGRKAALKVVTETMTQQATAASK
jgi:hypothetical protein